MGLRVTAAAIRTVCICVVIRPSIVMEHRIVLTCDLEGLDLICPLIGYDTGIGMIRRSRGRLTG